MGDETAKPDSENQTGWITDRSALRVLLYPNLDDVNSSPGISSENFFNATVIFSSNLDQLDANFSNHALENFTQNQAQNSSFPYESLWEPIDLFGKSAFSAVMTDLGQRDQPNILTRPKLLEAFTANSRTIIDNTQPDLRSKFFDALGPTVSFRASDHNESSLDVPPAVFSASYLCQVPHRKPWPELIFSVLLADLVFLRALWWLVNFLTTQLLSSRDKTMNMCECCCDHDNGKDENAGTGLSKTKYVLSSQISLGRDLLRERSIKTGGRYGSFRCYRVSRDSPDVGDDALGYYDTTKRRHSH
ncbi:hypothetical protein M434DRAFT_30578 [Hypoxylon sp. CO27-5]|nr:hypothetical protein M434DRAFT_30578 [Hypoxylon sp. CO27-5]